MPDSRRDSALLARPRCGREGRRGPDPSAEGFAQALAAGGTVEVPTLLVVAHPDDETLWAGSAVSRLANLAIVHLTDGAPRDMVDAGRLGFGTRASYAAARAAELDRALGLLGGSARRLSYGIADQETALHLPRLVQQLGAAMMEAELVLTHPYEGGHPDHDSAAFATAAGAALVERRGKRRPALVEFACYHATDGGRLLGAFWSDPTRLEHGRALPSAEAARLAAAVAAFETQRSVIGGWRPAAERWRAAPAYDFAAPPPPGLALYDGFGWSMTSARWRNHAAATLVELGLCP